jgi:hypothetical protein
VAPAMCGMVLGRRSLPNLAGGKTATIQFYHHTDNTTSWTVGASCCFRRSFGVFGRSPRPPLASGLGSGCCELARRTVSLGMLGGMRFPRNRRSGLPLTRSGLGRLSAQPGDFGFSTRLISYRPVQCGKQLCRHIAQIPVKPPPVPLGCEIGEGGSVSSQTRLVGQRQPMPTTGGGLRQWPLSAPRR